MASYNFSWIENRRLAGAGIAAVFDTAQEQFKPVSFLHQQGIKAILSLTEKPIQPNVIQTFGMEYLHSPIRDYQAPTMNQLDECLDFITTNIRNKKPVVVHCWAGHGRTGTILAAYFIDKGWSWEDAIDRIRHLREGSIESEVQIAALQEFHLLRSSILKGETIEISH